jgi:2-haloacid dehalogenase
VARIERVTPAELKAELGGGASIGPAAMCRALRTQSEVLGFVPNAVVGSLSALPGVVSSPGG